MSSIPIILDTDPGIDDAVALMLILASPELDLLGITTVDGNVGREQTFENAHKLLELFGIEGIPVGFGHPGPEGGGSRARHIHGEDGLGNTGLPLQGNPARLSSVDLLLEIVGKEERPVTLLTIGPLTNIAEALKRDPDWKEGIERVVVMGGAAKRSGNVTPSAEANIHHDPEAAATVFSAGLPLQLVPLDVTTLPRFTPSHLDRFEGLQSKASDFFRRMMRFHIEASRKALSLEGSCLHDALAVASLLDPGLLRFEPAHCVVETKGEWTRGMTLCDFRYGSGLRKEPNLEVALEVEKDLFLDLLRERLKSLLERSCLVP